MGTILMPCPFCGSADVALRRLGDLRYVECRRCLATGPTCRKLAGGSADGPAPLAAVAWNRRSPVQEGENGQR